MTSTHSSARKGRLRQRRQLQWWLPLLLLAAPSALLPQNSSAPLTIETPAPLRVKPGATGALVLRLRLASGFHTNSNTPADEYLIPLRLTWDASIAPFESAGVLYPKGTLEKYEFSEKPVSVYSGEFQLTAKLKAPAAARKGQHPLTGKLRYQACTKTTCFPPRSMPVQAAVIVE